MFPSFRKTLPDRRMIWLIMAVLLPITSLGSAQGGTPITAADIPMTITTPGNYYLTTDILGVGEVKAIHITASGVNLDLNGYTLAGSIGTEADCSDGVYPDSSVGIWVQSAARVKVSNGAVQQFGEGIIVEDASAVTLDQVEATGNCFKGVEIMRSSGVRLKDGVLAANYKQGLFVADSQKTWATGLTANGNRDGLMFVGAEESLVKGNQVFDNSGFGIHVACGDGTSVRENTVTGNIDGISFGCGSGVTSSHQIVGNVVDGNQYGISLNSSVTATTVQNNTVTGSEIFGILVVVGGAGNRIQRNTAVNSGNLDIYDGNIPACLNTWKNNTFNSDNEWDGPGAGCIQ